MDSERFDRLVRTFGQPRTRRQALRGLAGAGALAALLAAKPVAAATAGTPPSPTLGGVGDGLVPLAGGRVAAQASSPVASPVASPAAAAVQWLFVQTAGATTLTPGTGDTHTLTMTDVTAQTLYFSDRPNRIAGATPTAAFVDRWATSFGDSAPNATLIGHPAAGGEADEAAVVELLEPVYDAAVGTLTYRVRILQADEIGDRRLEQEPLTALDAPRAYAEAHLFIDDADTTCTATTCPQGCCGGVCVDLFTDDANCGLCGNVCSSDMTCTNGTCCGSDSCQCGQAGSACVVGATCCLDGACYSVAGTTGVCPSA